MSAPNTVSEQEHQNTDNPHMIVGVHDNMLHLRGLLEAMDQLRHMIGPKGLPVDALITSASSLAREIESDLCGMREAQQ